MRKIVILFTFYAMILSFAQEQAKLTISNDILKVIVNPGPQEAGRFSIWTTGGDPQKSESKNQRLIFGGSNYNPWTSYTTVKVDGIDYAFGGKTERRPGRTANFGTEINKPIKADDGSIKCTYRLGEIDVEQTLLFVNGVNTGNPDTVLIKYNVKNIGTDKHKVSIRLMLDTMCGNNDGAPIRIGDRALLAPILFESNELPADAGYWQAFDSLSRPTVISQNTLKGSGATQPQKILFSDWGTVADDPWIPAITQNSSFIRKGEDETDTAVALYWISDTSLEPGQEKQYATNYGLGYIKLNGPLGISAPKESSFEYERTQPFTVMAYLQNTDKTQPLTNVVLNMALPDGLSRISGNDVEMRYPLINPGETIQASWLVKPNGKKGGTQAITVKVASPNLDTRSVSSDINISLPTQQLRMSPEKIAVPLTTNGRETIIPISMTLSPAEKMTDFSVILKYDPAMIGLLDVSRGSAFVEDGALLKFDFDNTEEGKIKIVASRKDASPLTQAEARLAILKFYAITQGKTTISVENVNIKLIGGIEKPVDNTPVNIEISEK